MHSYSKSEEAHDCATFIYIDSCINIPVNEISIIYAIYDSEMCTCFWNLAIDDKRCSSSIYLLLKQVYWDYGWQQMVANSFPF